MKHTPLPGVSDGHAAIQQQDFACVSQGDQEDVRGERAGHVSGSHDGQGHGQCDVWRQLNHPSQRTHGEKGPSGRRKRGELEHVDGAIVSGEEGVLVFHGVAGVRASCERSAEHGGNEW